MISDSGIYSRILHYAVFLLLLFFQSPGYSQAPNSEATALVNGRVIDGTGAEAGEDWVVIISGDIISAVGPDVPIPEQATVIDLQGMSVLPGLIDMHGHIYANLGQGRLMNQKPYLKLYLAGGITTIFSPGEFDPESSLRIQKEISDGLLAGPDYFTTGPYFDPYSSPAPGTNGFGSIEDLKALFNLWVDKVDGIKVYTKTTEAELREIIKLAHDHNLPVTGHLGSVTASRAIDLGIDGLEHGIFGMPEFFRGYNERSIACRDTAFNLNDPDVDALIQKIVDHQVYLTPTIVQFEAMTTSFEPVAPQWQQYLSENIIPSITNHNQLVRSGSFKQRCLAQALKKQNLLLKEIHNLGGLIVTGTDPVGPLILPGYALHREMELLVEAGLTPMEAIQAATLNAAKALRKDAEYGSIEAGKLANLVIVNGNPAQSIRDIGNVVTVYKRGVPYDPDSLRASVIGAIGAKPNEK